MAKDASQTKSTARSTTASSTQNLDQQKIPPLRIVLNAPLSTQKQEQASNDEESSSKSENSFLVSKDIKSLGGKARYKLGKANKSNKIIISPEEGQKSSGHAHEVSIDNNEKNPTNPTSCSLVTGLNTYSGIGHLRRITRRSQRSANNEQDESESFLMIGNEESQDCFESASESNQQILTGAASGSNNDKHDGSRKAKRRRGDNSESNNDNSENNDYLNACRPSYDLPLHNSIELFKSIRKQVDHKISNLNSPMPKIPHAFRDYMLNKGSYLLDGNKLGNGKRLENDLVIDGQQIADELNLNSNQANVPPSLITGSPLFMLFIEQDKQRRKMRRNHIKEREKLMLSAEQEMMRAYNQATLAALNQEEPFSACTLLKFQEIYNYIEPEESNELKLRKIKAASDDLPKKTDFSDDGSIVKNDELSAPEPKLENNEIQTSQLKVLDKATEIKTNPKTNTDLNVDQSGSSGHHSETNQDSIILSTEPGPERKGVESNTSEIDTEQTKTPEKNEESIKKESTEIQNLDTVPSKEISSDEERIKDANETENDRINYHRSIFLSQLQIIDDKWEKIRNEMMIRHQNESESLHAMQKLEWEWKVKEIGSCDVRSTPVIEEDCVPKLNIYLSDY